MQVIDEVKSIFLLLKSYTEGTTNTNDNRRKLVQERISLGVDSLINNADVVLGRVMILPEILPTNRYLPCIKYVFSRQIYTQYTNNKILQKP